MAIAVIDIGKTNAKVVLVSPEGEELDERRTPNTVLPGPPYRHFDADRLWGFILDALRDFAPRVDAIVPVTHGACAALVDGQGDLVLPVLDYEDGGPDTARATYTPPDFAETGSPPLPGGLNVGAQLHFLEGTQPGAVARARHLLFWPQYWGFRLTGTLASEVTSLGCHTDLWAPRAATPSTLAERRDWSRLLPPLHAADAPLGPITADVARATGLAPDMPVLTGIHDSNASLVPYLDDAPCGIVSTGTWVIVMALGGDTPDLDPAADTLLNVAADGRLVPSARFMGGRDRDAALADGGPSDPVDVALAQRTATCLTLIGADGPIYVEGPFSANRTYTEALAQATGRPVIGRGNGAGTTVGAARLARAVLTVAD